MKRLVSIITALCLLILATSSTVVAESTAVLPAEIREFFNKSSFDFSKAASEPVVFAEASAAEVFPEVSVLPVFSSV